MPGKNWAVVYVLPTVAAPSAMPITAVRPNPVTRLTMLPSAMTALLRTMLPPSSVAPGPAAPGCSGAACDGRYAGGPAVTRSLPRTGSTIVASGSVTGRITVASGSSYRPVMTAPSRHHRDRRSHRGSWRHPGSWRHSGSWRHLGEESAFVGVGEPAGEFGERYPCHLHDLAVQVGQLSGDPPQEVMVHGLVDAPVG